MSSNGFSSPILA